MPDDDFPHTAEIWREVTTVVNGRETVVPTKVLAAVDGLVEAMGSWRQQTILGHLAGYVYHWTWGTEALQEGDELRFVASSMADYPLVYNKTYRLKLGSNDTLRPASQTEIRPYQTGFIEEAVPVRDA